MKGRTKLPSLCPCVVGRFTSLPSPSFPPLPSVSSPPSALHVSWELAGRPVVRPVLRLGRLTMCGVWWVVRGWQASASTSVHIASNMRAASSPLSAREQNVRASGFSFPSLSSVFGSFFNCQGEGGRDDMWMQPCTCGCVCSQKEAETPADLLISAIWTGVRSSSPRGDGSTKPSSQPVWSGEGYSWQGLSGLRWVVRVGVWWRWAGGKNDGCHIKRGRPIFSDKD